MVAALIENGFMLVSSEGIVQNRFNVTLALLTFQLPVLIFIFELASRTLLLRKAFISECKIQSLFTKSLLTSVVIVLFAQIWFILPALAVILIINLEYFNIAYTLASHDDKRQSIMINYMFNVVAKTWGKKALVDCNANYPQVASQLHSFRQLLMELDKGLFKALGTPSKHGYLYWLDLLRTLAIDLDNKFYKTQTTERSRSSHTHRSIMRQSVKDMYINHLEHTLTNNHLDCFTIILNNLLEESMWQFIAMGRGYSLDIGGAGEFNTEIIERTNSLLKEANFLLFKYGDASRPAHKVKIRAFKKKALKGFLDSSSGIKTNITWSMRPFFQRPEVLESLLQNLRNFAIVSFYYKQETAFQFAIKELYCPPKCELIKIIREEYGKNYVSQAYCGLLSVYRHIKGYSKINNPNHTQRTSLPHANSYIQHIVNCLTDLSFVDITEMFTKIDCLSDAYHDLHFIEKDFAQTYDKKCPQIELLWLDLILDKSGSNKLQNNLELYADCSNTQHIAFLQGLHKHIASKDFLEQFNHLSKQEVQNIRNIAADFCKL